MQRAGKASDAASPFTAESLFPHHSLAPSSPEAMSTPQDSVDQDRQADSSQANCLDSPPVLRYNSEAASISPCSDAQLQHFQPLPRFDSVVLCGKPIALDTRTASAPISMTQDHNTPSAQHQAVVKRTRSDSEQFVRRNFANLAALDRSLDAYHAWQANGRVVSSGEELQRPTKRHQLSVSASPPFQPCCRDPRSSHVPSEQSRSQVRQLAQPEQKGMQLACSTDDCNTCFTLFYVVFDSEAFMSNSQAVHCYPACMIDSYNAWNPT